MTKESVPTNIDVPDGYRAIQVETGINDTDYIEIKSGLTEKDQVRTLDTESSVRMRHSVFKMLKKCM